MNSNVQIINHRKLSTHEDICESFHLDNTKNYLFELDCLGVIDLIGENTPDYLQGQISCDVKDVNQGEMRQGAFCNLKGRVLALSDVVQWQGLKLIVPQDLMEKTISSLSKTAVLSRISVQANTSIRVFGFLGNLPGDIVPFNAKLPMDKYACKTGDGYFCYSLGGHRYVFLVEDNKVDDMTECFKHQKQYRGSFAWHYLQLEHNAFEIYPETRGMFLPHEIGLQHTGHVSFNKGCYKGQEIVARMHFKGKIKHEFKVFKISHTGPLASGIKLMDAEGKKEIGELVDFCPLDSCQYIIAVSILCEHADTCMIEGNDKPIKLESWPHHH
jgi:tRNA-modifying protein YgfZ